MAWLSGWSKRVKITIDQTDIDADLTWFPVTVHISSSCGRNAQDLTAVFTELGSNSKKIAITQSDGTTQLYVEIEQWNYTGTPSTSEAWLHTSITGWTISGTVDTDLYLYFDNTHADNTTYVGDVNSTPGASVWDSYFKGVYHMSDGADTGHIYDSTANSYDGTKLGANEPIEAAGKLYKGQSFDGSNDYISLGSTNFDPAGTVTWTVEAWIKRNTSTSTASIAGRTTTPWGGWAFVLGLGGATTHQFKVTKYGVVDIYLGTMPANTDWHHVLMSWNSGTNGNILYIDGASNATSTQASNFKGGAGTMYFNALEGYSTHTQDETRVSSVSRSAAWAKATYESTRDHLLAWGGVELLSGSWGAIMG